MPKNRISLLIDSEPLNRRELITLRTTAAPSGYNGAIDLVVRLA